MFPHQRRANDQLKRIREAEDQFAQDLIDAEYDEEQELLLDEAEASSDVRDIAA